MLTLSLADTGHRCQLVCETPVTVAALQRDVLITEYGIAALHGRDLAERTRAIIGIAAPQLRDDRERAAYRLHLLS